MRLVYVNSGNSSVMEAQVLSLLDHYKKMNQFDEIILLQGCKNRREKEQLLSKLKKYTFNIVWFNTWYDYTFFYPLALYSIGKVLRQINLDDQTMIHVRGELYGGIIHKYLEDNNCRSKLLIDMRGLVIGEINSYYRLSPILKWNKVLLYKKTYNRIKSSSHITVISNAFKKTLISDYGFYDKNICVHPNIASQRFTFDYELRNKIRKELGLNDGKIVAVCSSGGGDKWQKDYLTIQRLLKLGVQIINLSINQIHAEGIINKVVPFDQVPGYLAAADVAILWRDHNIINEIASPSKFSEFACMGLPVIHNGTVGLVNEYITSNNIGLIAEAVDDITEESLQAITKKDRMWSAFIGRNSFGVEHVSLSYIRTYKRIIAN